MDLHISIRDDKADLFLQILKEFKNDMVEAFKIIPSDYVREEEQKEIEEILNSRTAEDKEVGFSKTIQIDV